MFVKIDEVGRILSTVTTSQKFADQYPDYVWVEADAVSWDDHYVAAGQVELRPEPESIPSIDTHTVVADGASFVTLTNIPVGAQIKVSGPIESEWTEELDFCEISVDVPGRYVLSIEKWPQKKTEVAFNAT